MIIEYFVNKKLEKSLLKKIVNIFESQDFNHHALLPHLWSTEGGGGGKHTYLLTALCIVRCSLWPGVAHCFHVFMAAWWQVSLSCVCGVFRSLVRMSVWTYSLQVTGFWLIVLVSHPGWICYSCGLLQMIFEWMPENMLCCFGMLIVFLLSEYRFVGIFAGVQPDSMVPINNHKINL